MAMKNYLCLQRSKSGAPNTKVKPSPAQMEEMYARFNAWKEKYQDNIVDMGGRLKPGKIVSQEGVTDGPFVEVKELIGGYMIVQAETMEEAIEVARESPGVHPGSVVEVREISRG